ncbi:hypothetical protein RIR_jg42389.t1 [Rhizophagus irregularis DAOM 181602=DAOM 197198]|nr:hypothetical protein RIR_jg42389.t1 [Rhizophagus irregularis DAOM 181602=DAOM 197198]
MKFNALWLEYYLLNKQKQVVYSNKYYVEELYFPRARYFINKSTMLKLKRHYFTAYDTVIDKEDGEVRMQVDKYTSQWNHKSVFQIEEFYGRVEYFMVYEYKNIPRIIAFIQ